MSRQQRKTVCKDIVQYLQITAYEPLSISSARSNPEDGSDLGGESSAIGVATLGPGLLLLSEGSRGERKLLPKAVVGFTSNVGSGG